MLRPGLLGSPLPFYPLTLYDRWARSASKIFPFFSPMPVTWADLGMTHATLEPGWAGKRGGAWNNNPRNCRSANRNYNNPRESNNNIGFRVVCVAPSTLYSQS